MRFPVQMNDSTTYRHSIRLKGFDYSQNGAYFITINTYLNDALFGEIKSGKFVANQYGKTVREEWEKTQTVRSDVQLDDFVVMPNHFHGIVLLLAPDRTSMTLSRQEGFGKPQKGTIPTIVRAFKAAVTKQVNDIRNTPGAKVWHRNYYERVIRNERELIAYRNYIFANPMSWWLKDHRD